MKKLVLILSTICLMAHKIATELVHKTARYDTTKPHKVRMAAGGGYVAILKRL